MGEDASKGDLLIYKTSDDSVKVDVVVQDESVWLSQKNLATLFATDKTVVSKHIKNILTEGELEEKRTVAKIATVQQEGERQVSRSISYYSLEMIIALGYRINSPRAVQFRQWATTILKNYLIKGYALDKEKLKNLGTTTYFDELLAEIREIRSSEKLFYLAVLRIYATSIDYDKTAQESVEFFKIVQNKMHWAAHHHTAVEIIYERANAQSPHMGLTSFKGEKMTKQDISVAKNYLSPEELQLLNRLVTMYLDFAEFQAMKQIKMTMKDWITKLDDFITMTGSDLLRHAGRMSKQSADQKAQQEYIKYQERQNSLPSQVEQDMQETLATLNNVTKQPQK